MAIAALVLGIVGLVISFIPCLGSYGLFLTIPGIVFGAIGLVKANKTNTGKGLAIAGLVCSIIGSVIDGYQCYVLHKTASALDEFGKELEKASKDLNKATKDLDKAVKDAANQ